MNSTSPAREKPHVQQIINSTHRKMFAVKVVFPYNSIEIVKVKKNKIILSKIIILICAITLVSAHSTHANKEVKRKPNLIFILADDLGYGDLGCFGQKKTQLEKFSEENFLVQIDLNFTSRSISISRRSTSTPRPMRI